ncbi:MAG: molybdopterin-dependent oxidoreductase [Deltaproteobacteria bacterium]|nr:molybdopterin-dependent oxidoreductase [Deltaproteobacteria bacterium]
MPGLGASFGRGGATTAQQDLQNADCVLIQGSSMAEAHPVGFRWVVAAKERGATIIHVDPRFSRTSALADIWAPIRAGGDIALLGGLIRWILEGERYFREYVVHYTNASCLLAEDYVDAEDNGGFFSGWDPEEGQYDTTTWRYELDDTGHPRRDPSLTHPRTVFQALRRHFARYTPDVVAQVAGIPEPLFLRIAEALAGASGPDKTAAICYAVGWTQHSKGVQIIRAAAILQLLLGNIGRPGGGIMALRGHASIQGSTDIPTLYNILPGYIDMPRHGHGEATLDGFVNREKHPEGWLHNEGKYVVSLLKAFYGRHATRDNDFGYGFMPRITGDHSHFAFFTDMRDGGVEGLLCIGQNPAVGGQNARLERMALSKLRWLVVRDLVEIESANFWKEGPEIERGELRPEDVRTEVFLMPVAGHAEKEGAFTNTQRLLQWREKAVDPPGDARSDAWFVHQLAKRLIARAHQEQNPRDAALRALDWWYPEDAHGDPDMEAVLAEINGWHTDPASHPDGVVHGVDRDGAPHHGGQVAGFTELAADGSTASGCWIYSGVFGPDGKNRAKGRDAKGPLGHGWGYAWPADRRILYNRASARPDGAPWSERKKLVWWDDAQGAWVGDDVPDFPKDKRPDYEPAPGATGVDAHPGDAPFLMHDDGLGHLFATSKVKDGPFPTHFEPIESLVRNALYPVDVNPAVDRVLRPDNRYAAHGDPRFPYVLTTYRLTEHHTGGGMSRFLSHLAELQPELFVELSPELAAALGVDNGGVVAVVTARGAVETRALVSRRMRPIRLGDGALVHQVALPFHWGSAGPVRGDVANDLIAISKEPNVKIHESKALLCDVVPGPMPRGAAFAPWFSRWSAATSEETP